MQPECAKIRAPITGPAGAVALGSTFYCSVLVASGLRAPPVIQKRSPLLSKRAPCTVPGMCSVYFLIILREKGNSIFIY